MYQRGFLKKKFDLLVFVHFGSPEAFLGANKSRQAALWHLIFHRCLLGYIPQARRDSVVFLHIDVAKIIRLETEYFLSF